MPGENGDGEEDAPPPSPPDKARYRLNIRLSPVCLGFID